MKKWNYIILLLLNLVIISCSSDDGEEIGSNNESRIQLIVKGVKINASTSALSRKVNNAEVIFTDFKISIRDVIFKNDDDPLSNLDNPAEIQFRGPYQIDLLDDTDALSQTIDNVIVPDGHYKELRFKLHKSRDIAETDSLFDRSIYIEGTIDGVPFVFWHDTSENFDLGKSTGVLVKGGIVNFTVQFNISQFLGSVNQIDLGLATDNNNDGLIEISPDDVDGNQNIAEMLKENIKEAADLLD